MARIAGRGRYAGETYPEAARSSGTGGGGAPLSRTFYVGVNANPTPDGSIGNPFPDPQAAVDAIPPPVDALDAEIAWEILIAPGAYKIVAPGLTLPKDRGVSFSPVGYGGLIGDLGPTVIFADPTLSLAVDVIIPGPGGSPGGSVTTLAGILFNALVFDVSVASTQFDVGMRDCLQVGGLSKIGTHNALVELQYDTSEAPNTLALPGLTDDLLVIAIDSGVGSVSGLLNASNSFVSSFTPSQSGTSELRDSQIGSVAPPTNPNAQVHFASCEVFGTVGPAGAQGQFFMDSATLGSVIKNAGISAENGVPLSVVDATASQADFTPFDGTTGDVTLGPAGSHTLENFILMEPGVAGTSLVLPDATSWQIGAVPPSGSRSLYIRNRGTGVINVLPVGTDTTDTATVAAGTTLVITPIGTVWTKVIVG